MNIKLIPDEAMLAAHKHLPLYSKHQVLLALAAALEAWPRLAFAPRENGGYNLTLRLPEGE